MRNNHHDDINIRHPPDDPPPEQQVLGALLVGLNNMLCCKENRVRKLHKPVLCSSIPLQMFAPGLQ